MSRFEGAVSQGHEGVALIREGHREIGRALLDAASQMTPKGFLAFVNETVGEGNGDYLRLVKPPALAYFAQNQNAEDELWRAEERDRELFEQDGEIVTFKVGNARTWCKWASANWTFTGSEEEALTLFAEDRGYHTKVERDAQDFPTITVLDEARTAFEFSSFNTARAHIGR